MALKAVEIPNLHHLLETTPTLSISSSRFSSGIEDDNKEKFVFPKFVVMGHRGFGMNMLQSSDEKMKWIKENSLLSFEIAADFPIDFIEFDVQVTKDGFPVIFHDIFMYTQEQGVIIEKRVTEMNLNEFMSYGPQKDPKNTTGKSMLRKIKDGRIFEWKVHKDYPLCTLQEAFENVKDSIGFNIELKFDDTLVYREQELHQTLDHILKIVYDYAKDRPILFSSFQPDAAQLIRKLQRTYPVFFLTNGGSEIYKDIRRNSLEEAIKICKEGGLQGIVSEVKAILRNPNAVSRIKNLKLSILSYGQLNNVAEVVYLEYLMGVEGVIVDMVKEITEAIRSFQIRAEESEEEENECLVLFGEEKKKVKFSKDEFSFLSNFVPKLLQQ